MSNKDEFRFMVNISKIHIETNCNTLSLDVIIGNNSIPYLEIINIQINHLDDITGIELPKNFNPQNFREEPAIVFFDSSDMIYFKEKILNSLLRTSFIIKFFQDEEIPQNQDIPIPEHLAYKSSE